METIGLNCQSAILWLSNTAAKVHQDLLINMQIYNL